VAKLYISSRYMQVIQFAFIGVLNTAIHASVVIGLVEHMAFRPVVANAVAFFFANIFSYCLNSRITFKSTLSFGGYLRFLSVSLVSLGGTLIISWLGEYFGIDYRISLIGVIILVPAISFLALKFWAFSSAKPE
jgi:putative flippase GtrA